MISIFADGSSRGNPGKMSVGIVVKKDGRVIKKFRRELGVGTNNEAEYWAAYYALREAKSLGKKGEVVIYMDSLLVVNQINGKYKVKAKNLRPLYEKVMEMKNEVKAKFEWIGRERNAEADGIAKGAPAASLKIF